VKKSLADALEHRGYTTLTPVQEAVTEPGLVGADLLVSAQTGSGKTLGFGLAIAPTILSDDEKFSSAALPLALVIAPTRELAMQVKRELAWLYAMAGAVVTSCVGGMDMRDERRSLARGAHIVVATPGRLRDHIMRGSIDLSAIRAVVLDEADEMLDLGFREDLEFILGESPEDRQTLMFSATVPAQIVKLAKSYQKDAVRVSTKSESTQHSDIEYHAMTVSARDGENAIINVLRYYEAPNAIVFCNTRAMVNRLTTRLSNRGFSVVALSGELSQNERTHALQAMRDGRARVCVATDVAARGIDLPNLDLVVHAELPSNHETVLHRSGRTGRAGRKGVSALIVEPKSRRKAERILGSAKVSATWTEAPSADAVKSRDQERMLADPAWQEDIAESDAAAVETLVGRFTPAQMASAYLKLYYERYSAPEELSAVGEKPAPRAPFGPSVWFSIPGGREQDAEPRRLLPMLCKAGDITKDDIGAIRIQQDASYIEIRQESVAAFLAAIGPDMKVEDGAQMKRLDNPPSFAKSPRPGPARGKPRGDGHRGKPRDDGPRGKPRDAGAPRGKPRDEAPAREKSQKYSPLQNEGQESAPKWDKPKPSGTTKPVDWNDDPAPRVKKPKPGAKRDKPKFSRAAKPEHSPDVVAPKAPSRKPDGRKPDGGKPRGANNPSQSLKGPPPPKGKSSSKKNKARAQVRAATKSGGKPGRGGNSAPRRGKS